jgi:hypothetical protein
MANQEVHSFSQSIAMGQRNLLIDGIMAASSRTTPAS